MLSELQFEHESYKHFTRQEMERMQMEIEVRKPESCPTIILLHSSVIEARPSCFDDVHILSFSTLTGMQPALRQKTSSQEEEGCQERRRVSKLWDTSVIFPPTSCHFEALSPQVTSEENS